MRRNPSEEGLRWLEQAREDLRWTEHLAGQGGYRIACFLAQQVAEKALKAFLYAQGEELVIGHSVERLCHSAVRFDSFFAQQVKRWTILDAFYVTTRYPHSVPDSIPARVYTQEAALEAVRLAQEVVRTVEERVGRGGVL